MNPELTSDNNHEPLPDEARLTAYVLDELDAAERAEVEAELARSEQSRAAVAEIRLAVDRVTAALATEPVGTLSSAARQAIERASETSHTGRGRSKSKPHTSTTQPFTRRFRRYAVAAALLAMFGVGAVMILPAMQSARESGRSSDHSEVAALPIGYQQAGGGIPHPVIQSEHGAASAAEGKFVVNDGSVRFSDEAISPGLYQRLSSGREAAPATADKHFYADEGRVRYTVGAPATKEHRGDLNYTVAKPTYETKTRPSLDSTYDLVKESDRISSGFVAGRPEDVSHNTEAYDRIYENPFLDVRQNPLSTFSIDVDTASYANVRRFINAGSLPPKDAVRIEEMLNYFTYHYEPPADDRPFAVHTEVAACPWQPKHRLLRIALKGREIDLDNRPASNLVFLVDVSGSMDSPDKLPLLKNALRLMIDKLGENDRVAMVVYAGSSGLVLPSTSGQFKETVLSALDRLQAGGSTNGASGIQLAYQTARQNLIAGGTNRVILATDGDFNVGITDQGALTRLIEDEAKSGVFLSVLGFGTGNLKDSTMEKLADRGNGNYAYIDTINEARKVLVEQLGGTLVTIAKDVKLQLEFNPRRVSACRLIGYENRLLRNEDFNDDTKDAGEIGAGHTVTALYELVPAGVEKGLPAVDELKYQRTVEPTEAAASDELLTLKLRYKEPDGQESKLISTVVHDSDRGYAQASEDFRFAAAVAGFGLVLRDSQYRGDLTLRAVQELATASRGTDQNGYRAEFIGLVKGAQALGGR